MAALALAVVLVVLVLPTALTYFKYPDAVERAAANHLEKVEVEGFESVGEEVDIDTVSRFWIKPATSDDTIADRVTYDGRRLRQDHPGRDSLSRSRYREELGWLALSEGDFPCALTAYRIVEIVPSSGAGLSAAQRRSVAAGSASLIEVAVACGGG